jgi:hypothetical protein
VFDDRFAVHFFAVVTAAVAGRTEEGLPLRGALLEEEVERLLGARLAFLLLFLAGLAVAGGDDLVAVFVDHRGDLRYFPGGRFGVLVDVDFGAGRHRGHILDVEQRLAVQTWAFQRPAFEGDRVQAFHHPRGSRGAEVARVELLHVRA